MKVPTENQESAWPQALGLISGGAALVDQEDSVRAPVLPDTVYAPARPSDLVHVTIESRAEHAPYHTAFEQDGEPMSYVELNARANRFANFLIGRGVRVGDVVAFHQQRTANLLIGLIGAMKAGAACLPIDPRTSCVRMSDTITAWNPRFIITSKAVATAVAPAENGRLVVIEEDDPAFNALPSQNRFLGVSDVDAHATAYIMFTTRSPNGVAVSHADATRFSDSLAALYGIKPYHRCYQDEGLAIDVAIEEMLAMLFAGATIVLRTGSNGPVAEFLARGKVTVVSTVPERLDGIAGGTPGLEVAIVGERPCPAELAVKWSLCLDRVVTLRSAADRTPTFIIEKDTDAWHPRMLHRRVCEREETK